jgi:hypothetical protein
MKTRCAAISLLLAILAAFTAVAQPSNDQCAGALVITGAEFTHT